MMMTNKKELLINLWALLFWPLFIALVVVVEVNFLWAVLILTLFAGWVYVANKLCPEDDEENLA